MKTDESATMYAHIHRLLEVILLGFLPGPKRYYHIMQSKGWMAKKGKKAGTRDDRDRDLAAANSPEKQGEQSAKTSAKTLPKARPKSAEERKQDRIDGIKKTVYPAALGVLAGFACYYDANAIRSFPWHFVLVVVIIITSLIQRYTYPFLKIDAAAFQTKDWLYVEFIAVDLWLVTWTLLLN
jgi:hypothetical protein